MNLDESNFLARRVSDLEGEVRALRRRVAALEGRGLAPDAPAHLEVQPLEPVPLEAPPLEAAPAAREAAAPAVPPKAPAAPPAPPSVPPATPTPVLPVAPAPAPAVASSVAAAVLPAPVAPAAPVGAFRSPAAPVPVPPAPTPSPLRELLAAVQLLPPSGQAAGEAGMGAWWATRIGALILVIGIVFFGVYVSLSTPPWVRLLELAVIAGGVTVAGLWIERRLERLGSVVMGAGLALCYFTTFAAYAVPPVKVVESVGIAAVLQAAAVAAIGAVALWRRAPTVATMAVLLGYVSAFFSLSAGFDDFAVAAGLGLGAMAVFFRRREGWGVPVLISGALVHLLIALVAIEVWTTETGQRGALFAFAVVLAAWGLHFLSLVLEGAGESGRVATLQRWLQSVNTSLAVMAGFAVALAVIPHELLRDRLSWYFFGAGAVVLGAAAWAWRAVPRDGVFGMFAVKAASLIALGVIVEWDARTRWVALAVQAAVIMAAAVRTQRVSLAAASVVAWLVSLLFFGEDVESLAGHFLSGGGIALALYLVGSAALLGWVDRWVRARDATKPGRNSLTWMLGGAAALPVGMAVGTAASEPWLIVACVIFSVVQLVVARVLGTAVPVVGGVFAMLAAHVLVQVFDESAASRLWLWAGAALVAVRSVIVGWHAGTRGGASVAWKLAGGTLLALALAAVSGALMQSIDVRPALACASLLALAATMAGARLGRDDVAGAGLAGLPLAWILQVAHLFGPSAAGDPAWLWGAAAAVPAALAVPRTAGLSSAVGAVLRALAAASGVVLVWAAAGKAWEATGLAWSLVLAAAAYLALGRWRRCAASSVAGSALLLTGAWRFLLDTQSWARGADAWAALPPVFLLLVALGVAPLVHAGGEAWLRPAFARMWRVGHAVAATGGFIGLATLGHAAWAAYGSVVWALGGVAMFLLGLRFRARPHRLAGLLALGLCIPRVFTYDIESTQYRIGAFVVLGVLLLIVGFSYQKFRHLIDGDDGKKPGAPDDSAADLKRPGA